MKLMRVFLFKTLTQVIKCLLTETCDFLFANNKTPLYCFYICMTDKRKIVCNSTAHENKYFRYLILYVLQRRLFLFYGTIVVRVSVDVHDIFLRKQKLQMAVADKSRLSYTTLMRQFDQFIHRKLSVKQ